MLHRQRRVRIQAHMFVRAQELRAVFFRNSLSMYTPSPVEAYCFTFLTLEDSEAWMRSVDASGALHFPPRIFPAQICMQTHSRSTPRGPLRPHAAARVVCPAAAAAASVCCS